MLTMQQMHYLARAAIYALCQSGRQKQLARGALFVQRRLGLVAGSRVYYGALVRLSVYFLVEL